MAVSDNLVQATSTSTGTGNFTLATVDARQSFNTAFGTGGTDVFWYFITHQSADEWEVGTGSLSDATTLVRDTVIDSSTGSAISFSAGTKDVTSAIAYEAPTGTGVPVRGTSPGFTTAANPTSNDGAALGTTALQWSDLFLAEGGVINWDNGDLTLTQTNNILDVAGGNIRAVDGVLFGSDTAAANMLDDYEEGTFSPTLTTSGTDFTSVTYNSGRAGSYQKIGNTVFVAGIIYTDAVTKGSASGNVKIGNLPFTSGSSYSPAASIGFVFSWLVNMPSHGGVDISSTTIGLYYRDAPDGTSSDMQVSDVETGSAKNYVQFAAVYNVA